MAIYDPAIYSVMQQLFMLYYFLMILIATLSLQQNT